MGKNFDIALRFLGIDKLSPAMDKMNKKLLQFSASAKKIGNSMKQIGNQMTTRLTLPIIAFGTYSLKSFMDQEKANAKLKKALQITNKESAININNLYDLADALQKVTKYEDESSIASLALTQQLADLNENQLKTLLPAIQDFAAAMDMDLMSATKIVAKSIATDNNMLGRYGIQIDKVKGKTNRFNAILEALNQKFRGTARAIGETTEGKLLRLKNQFGELAEKFGEVMLPYLIKLMDILIRLVEWFDKLSPKTKKWIVIALGIAAVLGPVIALSGQFVVLAGAIAGLGIAGPIIAGIGASLGYVGIQAHFFGKHMNNLVWKLSEIKKGNKAVKISFSDWFNVLKKLNPVIEWIAFNIKIVVKFFKFIGKKTGKFWGSVFDDIKIELEGWKTFFEKIFEGIKSVFTSIGEIWTNITTSIAESPLFKAIGNVVGKLSGKDKGNKGTPSTFKNPLDFLTGANNKTEVTVKVKSDEGTTAVIDNVKSNGDKPKIYTDSKTGSYSLRYGGAR